MEGMFITIPEPFFGAQKKCFEEVRIDDYIKAYTTTGRPPQPVPEEPKDATQRKILGLLPVFQPLLYKTNSEGVPVLQRPAFEDPAEIPDAQEFEVRKEETEKYHSISCTLEYAKFSHEELRALAYGKGHKFPPTPVKMDPFVSLVKPESSLLSSSSGAGGPLSTVFGEDRLQSISADADYNQHSPEELRVAFLLHGRQLTSAELTALSNPATAPVLPSSSLLLQPPTTPAAPPPVIATSNAFTTPTIPPPVFAKPNVPKFTFGLR